MRLRFVFSLVNIFLVSSYIYLENCIFLLIPLRYESFITRDSLSVKTGENFERVVQRKWFSSPLFHSGSQTIIGEKSVSGYEF